jgi:hypothetical protein
MNKAPSFFRLSVSLGPTSMSILDSRSTGVPFGIGQLVREAAFVGFPGEDAVDPKVLSADVGAQILQGLTSFLLK